MTAVRWVMAGPLQGFGEAHGWAALAGALMFAALLAWTSYRFARDAPGPIRRLVLVALRLTAIAGVLFCLADPERTERVTVHPKPASPPPSPMLAVLVDRSDSMTRPDNRGLTRLDNALALWRRFAPQAQAAFPRTAYYSFAADLRPAPDLDSAAHRTGATGQTRLYAAVGKLISEPAAERPTAIVVLTDGLDTTGGSDRRLRDAALAAQVPLYFVPGVNRDVPGTYVRVREFRTPATVLANTNFSVQVTFEAFSIREHTVPYRLWVGGRRIASGQLTLALGPSVTPWTFKAIAPSPGLVDMIVRLGADPHAPAAARAAVQVLPQTPTSVFIYQGALDWGYHMLMASIVAEPSFAVRSWVMAPAQPADRELDDSDGEFFVDRLPDSAEGYKPYNCIVLACPYPDEFGEQQQEALADYVRAGGGLLFIEPTAEGATQFQVGPLADLLPAVVAGGRPRRIGAPSDASAGALQPFVLTAAGRASPAFAGPGHQLLTPRYHDYLAGFRPKPGATVLAIASGGLGGTGNPLLITQRFGLGRTALLTTDGLWRWALAEPAGSHAAASFWLQLLFHLAHTGVSNALRFVDVPVRTQVDQAVTLRLESSNPALSPKIYATSPTQGTVQLDARPGTSAGTWIARWRPDAPGAWQVEADAESVPNAYAYSMVVAPPTGERTPSPTAVAAMDRLATETGGALLDAGARPDWRPPAAEPTPPPVTSTDRRLLWNRWPVLGLIIGCFGAELMLRRFWRMV